MVRGESAGVENADLDERQDAKNAKLRRENRTASSFFFSYLGVLGVLAFNPIRSNCMATFADFISDLEREGELARVKASVDPKLEIAGIADRMSKSPAPHGHNERDKHPDAA